MRLHFPLNLIFQSVNFAVHLSMMLRVFLAPNLRKNFHAQVPIHNKLNSTCKTYTGFKT